MAGGTKEPFDVPSLKLKLLTDANYRLRQVQLRNEFVVRLTIEAIHQISENAQNVITSV